MKHFLFLLMIPFFFLPVYGEEYSEEGTYTIQLTCNKAPSYSVKLPKSIDLNNNETTFTYEVKGDLYSDQSLSVLFDSSTVLTYRSIEETVRVNQNKAIWSNHELSEEYQSSNVTLTHEELKAGNYTGVLNVKIQLSEE